MMKHVACSLRGRPQCPSSPSAGIAPPMVVSIPCGRRTGGGKGQTPALTSVIVLDVALWAWARNLPEIPMSSDRRCAVEDPEVVSRNRLHHFKKLIENLLRFRDPCRVQAPPRHVPLLVRAAVD